MGLLEISEIEKSPDSPGLIRCQVALPPSFEPRFARRGAVDPCDCLGAPGRKTYRKPVEICPIDG